MKILIIMTLLLMASFASCQTDSIWVEGDNICMNKQKAIQFAKMRDSLLYFKQELALRESLLQDCGILIKSSNETIEGLQKECDFLLDKIVEIEGKLGLETEKVKLKEKELQSIVIVNDKVRKERRKFKVQRDILIGTGATLLVTTVVLIIITAI